MRLYGYWRSSATWRVRLALALKGVAVEVVPVSLLPDASGVPAHRGPAHRARNPMAQVPVLELADGALLTQSLAIIDYLEQAFPEPPLYPADLVDRARALAMAEVVNSGIQPMQNMAVLMRVKAGGLDSDAWARDAMSAGLAALEALVRDDGSFLIGTTPTIADCCLVPQLYNARRFSLPLDSYPRLLAAEAAFAALPAFAAAHPDNQPDAPKS